jgi:alpha-L-rhamnosidase
MVDGTVGPGRWQGQWIGFDQPISKWPGKAILPACSPLSPERNQHSERNKEKPQVVCGQGLFEWYINGNKIGNQVLAPALSEYAKRLLHDFDVTSQVAARTNALALF